MPRIRIQVVPDILLEVMPDILSRTLYVSGLSVVLMSTLQGNERRSRSRCRLDHGIIIVPVRLNIVPREVGSVRNQLVCGSCHFSHVMVLKAFNQAICSSPRHSLACDLILEASVENRTRLCVAHRKLVRLGDEVLKVGDQLIAVLSTQGTIGKGVAVGYKVAHECRLCRTVGERSGFSG